MNPKRCVAVAAALAMFILAVIPGGAHGFRAHREHALIPERSGDGGRSGCLGLGLETVRIANPGHAVRGDDGVSAIEAVREIMEGAGSEAVVKKIQVDNLGYRHVRLGQRHRGFPVVGAELIVHINNHDVIYLINGKYRREIAVSRDPLVSPDEALRLGLSEKEGAKGLRISKRPCLVIYGSHLAYHFVLSHEGDVPGRWWYYVDAHSGTLIQRYNNIRLAAPTGVGAPQQVSGYRLAGEDGAIVTMTGWEEDNGNFFLYNFDDVWGVYDEDALDWEQQAISFWDGADPAAISLGQNFSLIQYWVMNGLSINSFDNAGGFARGNVHTGDLFVNAYWDGEDFHFGDGDNVEAASLAVLDIAAHEYGHAITEHSSGLVYAYESGALDESFADIVGSAVEFMAQPNGTAAYPLSIPGQSDWLIGEDSWLAAAALRDMSDPQRFGQPSYYEGTNWWTSPDDNGGVHYNCGVQNFAFYLLSEGGSGINDGEPYSVTGIGVAAAVRVALRANMFYLLPSSKFIDSRNAWIDAAGDLGYSTDTVKEVWDAVGVIGYLVPDDFPTIQAAIQAAVEDDVIIVRDGVYTGAGNTNVNFLGKRITVRSQNGPENCIVDCENTARGFIFNSNETSSSVLEGITITNGFAFGDGGGLYVHGSSPTIRNCVISSCRTSGPPSGVPIALDNDDVGNGGGMYVRNSSATVDRCVVANNTSHSDGGGIYCTDSSISLINCNVVDNQSTEDGGGIEANSYASVAIINCSIVGNYCGERGGGIDAINGSNVTVTNCILWGNSGTGQVGISGWYDPSFVTIGYSDVQGGQSGVFIDFQWCEDCALVWGGGNIDADPLFVGTGDYHLTPASPCIDAGTLIGASDEDIDEESRPFGGGNDMGADEYYGDCTFSLAPSSATFDAEGGWGTVGVATDTWCLWTATSNSDWIHIIAGSGGDGNGTVFYSVSSNSSHQQRSGSIIVEAEVFVISQSGVVSCSNTVEPTGQTVGGSGGSGSVSVTAPETCEWVAYSNDAWITVTSGSSGSGYGLVNYSVALNPLPAERVGTITIGTETFVLTQEPGGCLLDQINLSLPADQSILTSSPTFQWLTNGCPNSAFAIDFSGSASFTNYWSTYEDMGLIINQPWWAMPQGIYNALPRRRKIYWRVRGITVSQPQDVVYSDETWWFLKW